MHNNLRGLDSRLLTAAVEASANGIVITDSKGTIEWVNAAVTTITGYSPGEVIGQNPRIFKSGEHPAESYTQLWQTITAGRPWWGEMINRRKDGSLYTEEMTVTPIQNEGGEITHFIAIKQDISARKQAERELERSRSRLELGLEATNQGLWDWDLASGTAYFSPHYHRMLGYEVGEIEPSYDGWRALVHPDDVVAATQAIQDYIDGYQKKYDLEFRLRKRSGEYVWVLSRGEVVSGDDSGRPARLIGTHTDITDRVKLEQQLRNAQKMEAVGLLAGGLAHDFNNILTVVNGYSDLIASSARTLESAREYAGQIRTAGGEAAELVRQLMAFSRLQVREPALMDVNITISEMERMFRHLLPENIEFATRLDTNLRHVLADPSQIHQVVMNLVVNARDAMPHGGRLEIETRNADVDPRKVEGHLNMPAGSYVMISVVDTGVGMDQQTQEHLFEPFFTTKPMGAGTGLGLSTVYGIVKQNGGWIWVSSEKGKGSAFKVYLPRAVGVAPTGSAVARIGAVGGNEIVLLIEDNIDVRRFLTKALEEHGYTVLQAGNDTEALSVSKHFQDPIDLLITDVVLPGANGREIAERMRMLRPGIAILFISGYTGNVILHEGVLEQGVNFLQKPFTGKALALRVREVLRKQNQSVKILIVDDEAAILELMAQILGDAGYHVLTAANGKQAMEMANQDSIDVVITDLVMPEQEGLETILELRKKNRSPQIIAMSGAFGGEFLNAARAMGARATLRKPISAAELLSAVRKVLR